MATNTVLISTVGAGTWTVPSNCDVTQNIIVYCQGGGGGGKRPTNGASAAAGGGGGGGASARSSVSISGATPGSTSYWVNVGAFGVGGTTTGANGGNGGDTWFNKAANSAPASTTNGALAKGGTGATTNAGAAGGVFASGISDSNGCSGGAGGAGGTAAGGNGGGGGGASGTWFDITGRTSVGNGGGGWSTTTDGGGGGGGGIGGNGVTATSLNGGQGGNGTSGTATGGNGGASTGSSGNGGAAGTGGGGGAGTSSNSSLAGNGGGAQPAADFTITAGGTFGSTGGGGGGGGTNNNGSTGGNGQKLFQTGGSYSGGGGGGGAAVTSGNGGDGGQGVIVIVYTTAAVNTPVSCLATTTPTKSLVRATGKLALATTTPTKSFVWGIAYQISAQAVTAPTLAATRFVGKLARATTAAVATRINQTGKLLLAGGGGGGGTAVTLNPSNKSAYVDLVDSNMALQSSLNVVGALCWAWATAPGVPAKGYFEVQINSAPSGYVAVGYAQGGFVQFGAPTDGIGIRNDGYVQTNNTGIYNGGNPTTVFVVGDIVGVAYDTPNSRMYIAINNVWIASSDPVAGTNPISVPSGGAYYAGVGAFVTNPDQRKLTMRFKASSQTYAAPSGYSAYEASGAPGISPIASLTLSRGYARLLTIASALVASMSKVFTAGGGGTNTPLTLQAVTGTNVARLIRSAGKFALATTSPIASRINQVGKRLDLVSGIAGAISRTLTYSGLVSSGTWSNSDKSLQSYNATDGHSRWAWTNISKSSGKWYCEIFVDIDTTGQFFIGIGPADPTSIDNLASGITLSSLYGGYFIDATSGGYLCFGQFAWTAGTTVVGLCFDIDNNLFWLGRDNTWLNGGNPSAGTGGLAWKGAVGTTDWSVGLGYYIDATHTAKATVRLVAADQTYSPPTGATAFGAGGGSGNFSTSPIAALVRSTGKLLTIASALIATMTKVFTGGSGTNTPLTLQATTAPVARLIRSLARLLQAVTAPVATLVRSLARLLQATTAPVATLVRAMARSLQATTAPVATLVRRAGKSLQAVTTPIATLVRAMAKSLQATTAPVATRTQIGSFFRTLTAATAPVASLVRGIGKKLQAVTGTNVATLSRPTNKFLQAITGVNVATLSRPTGKFLQATTAPVTSLVRRTSKFLTTLSALVASMTKNFINGSGGTTPLTLQAVTGVNVATLFRAPAKALQASTALIASLVRRTNKPLQATTAPVATRTQIGSFFRTLTAVTAPVATLVRGVGKKLQAITGINVATLSRPTGKSLQATTSPVATLRRALTRLIQVVTAPVATMVWSLARLLTVVTAPVASLVRVLSRRLQANSVVVATLTALHAVLVTLQATTAPVARLVRSLTRLLQTTTAPVASLVWRMAKRLQALAAAVATLVAIPSGATVYQRTLTALTHPVATLQHTIVEAIHAFGDRLIKLGEQIRRLILGDQDRDVEVDPGDPRVIEIGAQDRGTESTSQYRCIALSSQDRVITLDEGGTSMESWPTKDPQDVLDYGLDWTKRLAVGETILTSTWTQDTGGTTVKNSAVLATPFTTIWLSGGDDGTLDHWTNHVITSGGRSWDKTIRLRIRSI